MKGSRMANPNVSFHPDATQELRISGVAGVSWDKGKKKWKVRICKGGKYYNFGHFICLEEALEKHKQSVDLVSVYKPKMRVKKIQPEQKSERKIRKYLGNTLPGDGWSIMAQTFVYEDVEWCILYKITGIDFISLKVAANGYAQYKGNYWLNWKVSENRFCKSVPYKTILQNRPNMSNIIADFMPDIVKITAYGRKLLRDAEKFSA
jgi:hypothetical protein